MPESKTTPKNPCRGVTMDEAALMVQTNQATRAQYSEAGFDTAYLDAQKRPVTKAATKKAEPEEEPEPDTVEEITDPGEPAPGTTPPETEDSEEPEPEPKPTRKGKGKRQIKGT